MYTDEENKRVQEWWTKLGTALQSLPSPTKPGVEAEAGGFKFRVNRWRDGLTFEWKLSWELINATGKDTQISGAGVLDTDQTDYEQVYQKS